MILFEATTPGEFAHFLANARAGQTVLYHVGYLAMDKAYSYKPGNARLPELQRVVWENRDKLSLTQKRLGPFTYEYRATRRSERREQEFREREDYVTGVRRGWG